MASFLCDLAKPFVDILINGAIAEARHVFCFTCIVKKFEDERASLEPQRETMAQRVKDARERDKDIQAIVGSWEKDIDELNQVDTKTEQTCFFGFCPDCIWRYKKGKELANNLEKIKELKGEKFENIELPRPVPGVERYSSKDYISFESRKSKYKELLDALKDDNNYITGLQGMGGTGKTTMAKEVGKELKQSEQFAYVVDTTVSFTPDVKKIQDDIAGSLRLELGGCNESDRPKKLWSRLTNGDKILVILDDVWDRAPPLDFDAIGIPKQGNHKGCRVLVTSRSKQTFNKMDCDKTIELGVLSEEDAWLMFQMYAGIRDNFPRKLIEKAREIAIECKQLPVAISVIASSLKGQQDQEVELDVTLNSLKQPVSMHGVDDDMAGIYKCLKFSYDYLKDEKAKGLFLLCSVFREDEEYSVELLTRLCIGVGLFGDDDDKYNDARKKVVAAKNKLVDSCLLLEDDEKHLKMHDLVRDAAHWIANEEIQCVKLFDKKQMSLVEKQTNIKYLLCEGKCMDLFSFNFDGSKLEALIVKVDRDDDCKYIEVPNCFFENVIKLRVLFFSGNDYRRLQSLSLPPSVQLLKNIRSMSFDNVDLGDISILGKLQRLETLELVRCKIKELPDQITKLRKFKLLKLKYCEIRMKNPFEVIKRCSSLEELYFIESFNDFCQEIILPELQRYQIERGGWKRYELSKYVEFCGDGKCQFSGETLKYCMQTAEVLCLEGIKGEWRNLMPKIVPVELGMNDLVELHLGRISQLQCLVDSIGSPVPILSNLVVLELENMENLEELFNGPLSFESLNNLEHLSIKDCKHLRSLFKCKVNLCNLKRITVENCPMLVSVLQFLSAQDLPLLEAIRIRKCDGLQYVFGQSQKFELVSLTELELSELPNFIGIFEECNHPPMSSCVKGSSSTSKAQIQLDPMRVRDQPHDCSVASESNSYGLNILECLRISSKILGNIKEIVLTHFPKMKSVFILSIDLIMQLETLEIRNCDELKHVIIDTGDHNTGGNICVNVFPKLKKLRVEDCEQLEYIFGPETNDHQNHMEVQLHFPELTDLYLIGLPSLVAMCPKQYQITFPSLKTLELEKCSQDDSIIKESNSYGLNIWEHLGIQSKILCNIKKIVLTHFPKMKSVFILSIDLIMQLETLNIMNCDELKHVIIDTGDHNTGGNICVNVFPKLKLIYVQDCAQLEYIIFGPETETNDHQNHMDVQLHFPELTDLCLVNLPSLVAMSPKQYRITFPSLKTLALYKCSQDDSIIKELSGTATGLELCNSNVENILSLNEIDGHQLELDLGLKEIELSDLPMMTCLFVGPKNSFSLKNLISISIVRCEKLKIAFSTSILRFLPELRVLTIKECKELEHITEDDLENKNSRTCFPKLEALVVKKCNKLKSVFPFSVCKELPKLRVLLITEANDLEEIFKSEDEDHQVDIPNLNIVAFEMLPSLCCAQGNQFQAVKNRFVRNCQKLTLTSASTTNTSEEIHDLRSIDYVIYRNVESLFEQLSSAEATNDVENVTDLKKPPTNSKELLSEQSMDQQHSLVVKPSQLEGSTSEKTAVATVSTISGTKNEPPIQIVTSKQKEKLNERSIDQQHSLGETDTIVKPSQGIEIEGTSKANNDQVSLNDEVNSNVEEQFSKGDEIIVSKSKPSSPSITSSKGDPSQKVENLSSSLLVKRELEQLVSKNHLDYENLSFLTDFLVKNPSVRLKDTSLSNRYKGCAYNLLAMLLKFLNTHNLLEVLGSCHSEFLELLQDARSFAFDKDWLDGVERRALFPEIQLSQEALEKLLDTKKRDVEVLHLKIDILSQHVEDLKRQLTSSEADLESIIQQKEVLRAPIGY